MNLVCPCVYQVNIINPHENNNTRSANFSVPQLRVCMYEQKLNCYTGAYICLISKKPVVKNIQCSVLNLIKFIHYTQVVEVYKNLN